jgi:GGDEF domain-containing protein
VSAAAYSDRAPHCADRRAPGDRPHLPLHHDRRSGGRGARDVGCRRVQVWLEANSLPTREGPLTVSVSIGTAEMWDDEMRIGETMERADASMYAQNRAGVRSFLAVG